MINRYPNGTVINDGKSWSYKGIVHPTQEVQVDCLDFNYCEVSRMNEIEPEYNELFDDEV
ncbi:MAG: hypothetical protein ACXADY_23070 [Candidatus Hodarchaeales archaeon]|jgi:hypothetical protein